MKIVGFQSGHDPSYCILEDGIPIVHEELERFTREKEPPGCGLKLFFDRNPNVTDIDGFAFGNLLAAGLDPWSVIDKNSFDKAVKMCDNPPQVFSHHQTHAANAFFTSNFTEAIVFTVDAGGNFNIPVDEENQYIVPETLGVFHVIGDESRLMFNKINQTTFVDSAHVNYSVNLGESFNYTPFNLGMLWNNTTKEVFGLSTDYPIGNQAGTVMAMATMGTPKYKELFGDVSMINHYSQYPHSNYDKLKEIASRSEQDSFDVAASLQHYTEDEFFSIMGKHIEKNKHIENLCFSGGVSLNCVMLAKVKKKFPWIKNVFCDPVPYDGGLSLGAARTLYHFGFQKSKITNNPKNLSPYLGVSYSLEAVNSAIEDNKTKLIIKECSDKEVVNLLAQEKIIAV